MNINFKKLIKFISELNSSNSTNDKVSVFSKEEYSKDEFILKILEYTYSTFKQYGVSLDNLNKRHDLISNKCKYSNIFDLLDALNNREITGHEALSQTNAFRKENNEFETVIDLILNRDLETRLSTTLINRVVPNLIPTFEVALANKYDDKQALKIKFENGEYFSSKKCDGVRLITIIDDIGNIKTYSREGKEFFTLDVIKSEVKKLNLTNTVLDGELCIVDENGNEDFQSILKEYKKKDHTIKNPCYLLFDILPLDVFLATSGGNTLSERIIQLSRILQNYRGENLKQLEQVHLKSLNDFQEMVDKANKNNWEGIMIRKDIPYEGKRSNNLLKVKKFFDAEYIVEAIDCGPFRVIVGGKEVTEDMLRNVTIRHKGYKVDVGSGFSIEQRRKYKKSPNDIIGKQITVAYFEETHNQNGEISLRFPTVKAIWESGKRDI